MRDSRNQSLILIDKPAILIIIGHCSSTTLMILFCFQASVLLECRPETLAFSVLTSTYFLLWVMTEVSYYLRKLKLANVFEHLFLVSQLLSFVQALHIEAASGHVIMYPLLIANTISFHTLRKLSGLLKLFHFFTVLTLHLTFYLIYQKIDLITFFLNTLGITTIYWSVYFSECFYKKIYAFFIEKSKEQMLELIREVPLPYCFVLDNSIKDFNSLFSEIANPALTSQEFPLRKLSKDHNENENMESKLHLRFCHEQSKLFSTSVITDCGFLSLMSRVSCGTDLIDYIHKIKNDNSSDNGSNFISIGNFLDGYSKDERCFNVYVRFCNYLTASSQMGYQLLFKDTTEISKYEKLFEHIRYKEDKLVRTAHEFKTPLICSTILAEELREEIYNQNYLEAEKKSESLQRLSDYIFFLIDDIIQSSKSEVQRKMTLAITIELKAPEDDISFCYEILQMLLKIKENAKQVTCELSVALEVYDCRIEADSVRLRQILLNFISNAVKFTKTGKINLVAQVDSNKKELVIEIKDTGIGMSEEKLKSLLNEHKIIDVEINKTMNKYGTGTGLIVAKTMSDMMGFKLIVTSELLKGSVFQLRIPIIKMEGKHISFKHEDTLYNSQYSSFNEMVLKHTTTDLPVILSESSADIGDEDDEDIRSNNANLSGFTERSQSVSKVSEDDNLSKLSNTVVLDNYQEFILKETLSESAQHQMPTSKKIRVKMRVSENLLKYKQQANKDGNSNKYGLRFSILSSKIRPYTSNLNKITKSITPSNFPKQILVCDDSPLLRNSLLKNLKGVWSIRSAFDFISCSDGIEALLKVVQDQLIGNRIKILMIDESMEYLSGSQTVTIIKSLMKESKIKKVLCVSVSANDQASLVTSDLYDMIITKPVTKKKLVDLFSEIDNIH